MVLPRGFILYTRLTYLYASIYSKNFCNCKATKIAIGFEFEQYTSSVTNFHTKYVFSVFDERLGEKIATQEWKLNVN